MQEKPSRLSTTGKWALGVSGAGMIFAAQTRPEDATSNIASWLRWLGIDRVPNALATTTADTWGTIFGGIGLLAALWWLVRVERRRQIISTVRRIFRVELQAEARPVATLGRVVTRPNASPPVPPPETANNGPSDQDIRRIEEGIDRAGRSANDAHEMMLRTLQGSATPSIFQAAFDRKKSKPQPQWIPFHKALNYLVYVSDWGANQAPVKDEAEFNTVVCREVRERLSRGEIIARGKRVWGDVALDRGTEEISTAFWVDSYFLPWGEIALASDTRGYASKQGGGGEQWSGIILDGDAMRRIWPPAPRRTHALPDIGLPPLAAMIEETRATCERGNAELAERKGAPEPAPRPSFQLPPEFGYAYPKAVLQAEVGEPKGQRSARDGKVYQVGVRMMVKNAHKKAMDGCSVFLRDIARDGKTMEVNEALRIGSEPTFMSYPSQDKAFGIVTRDISDPITPAPFLIKLASRDMPLAENSQYVLTLELRSPYPLPTLVFVQIDTGEGLDVHVQIIDQKLAEPPQ